MKYPKTIEIKIPYKMTMNTADDYEFLKKHFEVSTLNDLKSVIADQLERHVLESSNAGELNYIFQVKRKEESTEQEVNPKQDVKELLKTRERLVEAQELVQEQIEEVAVKRYKSPYSSDKSGRGFEHGQKLPWE